MATNIQHSTIAGRLTKRPELKQTGSGVVCCFTVAVNLGSGENKYTEFNECVARGKTAEDIARYFDKGDEIYVVCANGWRTREWTGKDKNKHFKMEHRVSEFRFLGNKSAQGGQVSTPVGENAAGVKYASPTPNPTAPLPAPNFEELGNGDDLPF